MDHDAVGDLYEQEAKRLLVFLRAAPVTRSARSILWLRRSRARTPSAVACAAARSLRGDNGAAWVWGIAHNVLRDTHRRHRAEQRALRRLGVARVALSDDEASRIEELPGLASLRGTLAGALESLNENQRDALRLRVVRELDYATVAERLGVSEATARARVSRGLRKLATAMNAARGDA
ncbi:MAG: sigma-70 family RNA polymerase sigma factor [Actinobacteria bacterium]|nr:sigma-70 family RNA polymerase sigma factor [Actinomycetota bacterium]